MPALLRPRTRALVALGHIDARHDHTQTALGALDALHGAALPAVLAGEHHHGVALLHVHCYSTSGASETIFM